jgi:hypothetical protein
MDERQFLEELKRINTVLEDLARRVSRLEGGATRSEAPAQPVIVAKKPEEGGNAYSRFYVRLAVVCFTLGGALVLRVAAQKGFLGLELGSTLGLVYCALLLGAAYLPLGIRFLARNGGILQYCGAVLAPLIVLETFHEYQALGVLPATAILFAFGSVGALTGALSRRRGLIVVSLAGATAAIVALGITPSGAALRGVGLLGFSALALGIAHKSNWPPLRPLILTPVGLILGLGVLLTARRTELPADTVTAMLLCVLAAWVLVTVNHVLRAKIMGGAEAVWLPLTTLWASGLAMFAHWKPILPVLLGLAVLLLGIAGLLAWQRYDVKEFLFGLLTTGGLGTFLSQGSLEPHGLALALYGLGLLVIGRRMNSNYLYVLSQMLVVGSIAFLSMRLLEAPVANLIVGLLAGTGLAFLCAAHAWLLGGRGLKGDGSKPRRWLVTAPLACTVVAVFVTLRAAAFDLVGPGQHFDLAQTVLLACLSLLGLTIGQWAGIATLKGLGTLGIGLLGFKVVFFDLFVLDGGPLLGSVLSLGLVFAVASLALRRRR